MDIKNITTLGALKKSGYTSKSIKEELRSNLINNLRKDKTSYDGILGFENTVLPDLERAILSKHNILFLGLRGQAKTRIARLTTGLLDEYIPFIEGTELNDDPFNPLSTTAQDIIAKDGDNTKIGWMHRDQRYVEKLATPDVSIADLVGDVDPIKAASLKLPYSDPRVIHYGLIPRAHRSIFVLNELPDLQARIQVSLFNILQEGDLQIRGFKLRMPLDILFIFTANPEDYTNRGSIITPLKDRIESQILTHYPQTIEIAKQITDQEIQITDKVKEKITIADLHKDLLESIVFEARESEFIDEKSGVSARMSISSMENLYSAIERRILVNNEDKGTSRLSDFWGIIPSITGKVELVYEGEQEGPYNVALHLISGAIKKLFLEYFPHPERSIKTDEKDPYGTLRAWFGAGNQIDLINNETQEGFIKDLMSVPGLEKLVKSRNIKDELVPTFMEFVLHGLTEFEVISKEILQHQMVFKDPLANIFKDM
ncbi:MAG: sigma 54-interacting transcriptional regulator [Saprospiraceae bacterium]|nr:sigma 54-interacting transcriptional regulator [Bacteroidia bacterium]NNL90884.1 sigma 54-interacting transcriptional regulator [Saprospiraceae bacterium]